MKSEKIKIEFFQRDHKNTVLLPYSMYEQINSQQNLKLKVGLAQTKIICHPNNREAVLCISTQLGENLGLRDGQTINAVIKNDKLCLGPVIGIFTSNGSIRNAIEQKANFRMVELFKANNESNTLAYYFCIKDIDFIGRKIKGTYYNTEEGIWEQRKFPLPEVLYDRGGGTLKKQQIISKFIREQIDMNMEIKKINSRYFFDKWETYEKLINHEDMAPYLPLTKLFTGSTELLQMFEISPTVYLKSCLGSNGKGVTRARKLDDGTYELSYFRGELVRFVFNTIGELVNRINSIFKDKRVIMQSAIDVIKVSNGNVDMRATVQRDESGKLGITAYPVRVGIEGCPVTSTKSGSTVYRLEDFFKKYFNYSDEEIGQLKARIDSLLFTSFKCVEEEYGSFGEIGIDFALDQEGKLWFIECNAKPGKDTLYLSYDKDTILKAFQKPLEYAKYISGF